jgi:hypothetical protein
MFRLRVVSALTLVTFLSATTAPALAGPAGEPGMPLPPASTSPSALRVSIDRAAEQASAQLPGVPLRRPAPVRKQMMGGGGGGMMVMTLLVTAASLAGTYFLVKELKKSTDEAANAQ